MRLNQEVKFGNASKKKHEKSAKFICQLKYESKII